MWIRALATQRLSSCCKVNCKELSSLSPELLQAPTYFTCEEISISFCGATCCNLFPLLRQAFANKENDASFITVANSPKLICSRLHAGRVSDVACAISRRMCDSSDNVTTKLVNGSVTPILKLALRFLCYSLHLKLHPSMSMSITQGQHSLPISNMCCSYRCV